VHTDWQVKHDEVLAEYSLALDEVWRLRRALAYEARAVEANCGLDLKSYPTARRRQMIAAIERMRQSAKGNSETVYAGMSAMSLRAEMRAVCGSETLTRSQWEAEHAI
jgi:hypothetical protein